MLNGADSGGAARPKSRRRPGVVGRLCRLALALFGWRLRKSVALPPQAVIIAYPHTSNWDFPLGILAKYALGINTHWVGKDSLFRWSPLAWVFRRLGGIPVNRRQPTGFTERMVEAFAADPGFNLALAPEGTRGLTPGWKSGFYRIALAAQVPVLLGAIDYGKREVGIVACLHLQGDETNDLARIAAAYAGCRGRYPEKAAPIRWQSR